MKKLFFIFVFIHLAFSASFSQKSQVSKEEAARIAMSWIEKNYPHSSMEGTLVYSISNRGDTLLYEYMTDSVSIIMSGHKGCRPILGRQKFKGSLLSEKDNLPEGISFFLEYYMEEINSCFENGLRNEEIEHDWDVLASSEHEPQRIIYIVQPLLTTLWGQSISNDYLDTFAYNHYIRPGINCSHCLVGCGATAMAQVMNYWQYPVARRSPRQFDWCNMSNSLWSTDYNYEKNKDAVAYLMFVCAELVTDNYSCTETTSKMRDIRDGFIQLDYSNNISYKKKQNYSSNEWETMIKDDLNNRMPIIYRGEGSAKHVFVCDGYSNDGLFHFNWGSVNADPGNFALTAITPSNYNNIQYNFTNKQEAIFNIKPSTLQNICSVYINLENFYYSNLTLLTNYLPHEIVPQTMTSLTSASISSPQAWRTIPDSVSAVYQAHEEIILQDGFEAELGCEFEARIEPCEQCEELRENGLNETNGTADIEDNGNDGDVLYSTGMPAESVSIDLFPNPTDGPLTMPVDDEVLEILVFTLDGRPVGGWHLTARTKTAVTLDVSPLAPAAYLLSVRTTTTLHTARFIKQ